VYNVTFCEELMKQWVELNKTEVVWD